MKTTVSIKILAILAASCAQAFALTYFAGKRNPETQEEKNMKYSTCYWGSSGDFETPPLPSKPGVNDTLATRWGWGYKLDIDANIQVGQISNGDGSTITAKGKTIKVKRGLNMGVPGGGSSTVAFEDCNLEFGGNLSISYFDGHRSIGNASLTLKNTKFNIAGTLGCIIPVHPLVNSNTRGGFNFVLEGKTVATFGEGTVIDTIFSEKPEQWAFKIQMVEEDGHIPALKFTGGEVNFTGCDLDVRISPKAKKGVYTLIEFANKKSQLGKLTRFTVNGNPCSMGQTVNVGALKATITEGKIGRNSKSDKNVILTIK